MSKADMGLTQAETIYCITVACTGITMIAALISLKGSPQRVWIVLCLGFVLLAILPIGVAMEKTNRRKRIPIVIGACFALTAYVWFIFLASLIPATS